MRPSQCQCQCHGLWDVNRSSTLQIFRMNSHHPFLNHPIFVMFCFLCLLVLIFYHLHFHWSYWLIGAADAMDCASSVTLESEAIVNIGTLHLLTFAICKPSSDDAFARSIWSVDLRRKLFCRFKSLFIMIVFAGTLQGANVPPATHNLWTTSKQKILPKDDKHRLWSFLSWLLQEIHEIPG